MNTFTDWLKYFLICIVVIGILWWLLLMATTHRDVSGPPVNAALDYQVSDVRK